MTRYRLERHWSWTVLADGARIGSLSLSDTEGDQSVRATFQGRVLGRFPSVSLARAAVVAAWEARGR